MNKWGGSGARIVGACVQYRPHGRTSQRRVLAGTETTLVELNAELFSRHASPLGVNEFVAVDDRGEDALLCPTRSVVDAMESSNKGGVAIAVGRYQTGL